MKDIGQAFTGIEQKEPAIMALRLLNLPLDKEGNNGTENNCIIVKFIDPQGNEIDPAGENN